MINVVALVGRTTKDIEVSKTQNGISYTKFTLACDRPTKEKKTDFIQVVAWRQSADFLGQYAKQGDIIGVDGCIETNNYEKDGQNIYSTYVKADQVRILGSNKAHTEANQYQDDYPTIKQKDSGESLVNYPDEQLPF